jgi:FG-GAP-like repeat/Abnormal spindle-like microcephaly-assoc'd, ASPM-SPD-2-Hydin
MRCLGVSLAALITCLAAAAPASAALPFTAHTVAVGTNPIGIASDSFAGPGSSDLVTANSGSSNVSLLLGNGAGSFSNASGSPFGGPTSAQDVATGDFNNDGNADVVGVGNGQVTVRLGNGSGGLSGPTNIATVGSFNSSVVTGDFNGDGNLDFATSNTTQQINVFLGNGSGTSFAPTAQSPIAVGAGSTDLDTADFNNDGFPDLVVTNSGPVAPGIQVFLGTGAASGAFTPVAAVPLAGNTPVGVAAGDVNNDGNADAVVANSNGGAAGVRVLLGNGAGGFSGSPASVNGGTTPEGVALGDFDGEGFLDIAVANNTASGTVTVLLNSGNGTSYTTDQALPAGNGTWNVTTLDADIDGNSDIAATNNGSGTVSVFTQTPPTASVSPTSLNFGNVVVNTQTGTRTVTLTNNGPQTIGPLASITGPNKDDFVRINDRCTPASIFVPPGGTCTIGVAAKPKSLGNKTATLEIASNAANSPQKVALSATGVSPAPVSQTAPSISGNAVRGSTLTCSDGTWTNSPTSFAFQWLRNGQAIPGATNQTYTLVEADVGQQIACRVTASNAGGSNSRTSSSVTPTAPAPTLTITVPRQSLNSALSKGVLFRAVCVDACNISAQLTGPVPPKKKRKSRRGRAARTAIVGRTSATLVGGTTRTLRVRISRAGKAGVRGKRSARFRLAVTATDPAGGPRTTKTTSITLKRATKRRARR